jgi:hypothetical protein
MAERGEIHAYLSECAYGKVRAPFTRGGYAVVLTFSCVPLCGSSVRSECYAVCMSKSSRCHNWASCACKMLIVCDCQHMTGNTSSQVVGGCFVSTFCVSLGSARSGRLRRAHYLEWSGICINCLLVAPVFRNVSGSMNVCCMEQLVRAQYTNARLFPGGGKEEEFWDRKNRG